MAPLRTGEAILIRYALLGLAVLVALIGGNDGTGDIAFGSPDAGADRSHFAGRDHRVRDGWAIALAQEAPRATPKEDESIGAPRAPEALPSQRMGGAHGDDDISALIAAYPWPYEEALAVARCENRDLDPTIISGTGDYGIFQINRVHAGRVGGDLTRLLIPEVNVRVAYELWADQGWSPWRWSKECHGF